MYILWKRKNINSVYYILVCVLYIHLYYGFNFEGTYEQYFWFFNHNNQVKHWMDLATKKQSVLAKENTLVYGEKRISIWGKIKIIGLTYLLHVWHCSIINSIGEKETG